MRTAFHTPTPTPRRPLLQALAGAAALTVALALGGCAATAPPQPAGSPGLALVDQVVRAADPAVPVSLQVEPGQVTIGRPIALQAASPQAGYLYVFQVGSSGHSVSLVFPNAVDGANYAPGANTPMRLPGSGWQLTARGPAGLGYFVAVVAREQQDLMRLAGDVAQGRIAIKGSYGAAMGTLREVAP